MSRKLVLLGLLLAGCSKGPEADLQYIKQARSLAAEWALVNEQASEGKLTATYVESMRQWLRDNLQTTAASLTQPGTPYAQEIQALLAEPNEASPGQLRAHSDRLKQIEDALESA
jgi:hypothetical protein